jgi:hypothetical protein
MVCKLSFLILLKCFVVSLLYVKVLNSDTFFSIYSYFLQLIFFMNLSRAKIPQTSCEQ